MIAPILIRVTIFSFFSNKNSGAGCGRVEIDINPTQTRTNDSEPAGEPLIWHGNAEEYTAERITSADSMEKAEKFFKEDFNKSLADEIFGPKNRGGQE